MFNQEAIIQELQFKAIKSSGSGGQHVNKTASKIELTFNIDQSQVLNDLQKARLKSRLRSRLSKHFDLIIQCDESRSQHKNKTIVIGRFLELLKLNLIEEKERKATKVPRSVKRKRLDNKKKQSEKKANRKPPKIN